MWKEAPLAYFIRQHIARLFEEMYSYTKKYGGVMSFWNVANSEPDRTVPLPQTTEVFMFTNVRR